MHDPSTEGRENTLYGTDHKHAYLMHLTAIIARHNSSIGNNASDISEFQYSEVDATLLDTVAIFKWMILSTVVGVGMLANGVVVLAVSSDRQLQTSLYATLATLATSDLVLLFSWFVKCISDTVEDDVWRIIAIIIYTIAWTNSSCHMVLLMLMRYCVVVHPFQARYRLSAQRIVTLSLCLWTVCSFISPVLPISSWLYRRRFPNLPVNLPAIYVLGIYTFFACVITTINLAQRCQIQSILRATKDKEKAKVSRIVSTVIMVYLALELPEAVSYIFGRVYGHSVVWVRLWRELSSVLFVLNNAINPVLYIILLPVLRDSIGDMFRYRWRHCVVCKLVSELNSP